MNNRSSRVTALSEVFPSDMPPVLSPKHALASALGQLQSSDW